MDEREEPMAGPVSLLRVFPRRTTATPTDERAYVGNPPLFWPEADEVHVSVAFTWDRAEGERLADAWTATGLPVKIGGPGPDDLEPLRRAGAMLAEAGVRRESHRVCAYVLIGHPGDTMDAAETRMFEAWSAGFWPFAMLYRDERGDADREWRRFQKSWCRPPAVATMLAKATI